MPGVSILGTGLAGLGHAGGRTDMEILAQASGRAVRSSGLKMSDIDGVITASLTSGWWTTRVAEYLGLRPRFSESTMFGGSSFIAALITAEMAIHADRCSNVLICYGATPRSTGNNTERNRMRAALDPQPYEHPFRLINPVSSYALAASRHMAEFGTTREQLAEVAVAARAWAELNPDATLREPLTLAEVLDSPMISDPLSVRDCCLVTDGAAAFVVSASDAPQRSDLVPVRVAGVGHAHDHRQISEMPDLTRTAAVASGREAFRRAKMAPTDIDVLEIYDAFTITPIMFLEDLGFCEKGEGGPLAASGRIAPGGDLPMNTNGGGLSCVHPGMYSAFLVVEAVAQLRGEAGARQVPGARTALVHGNGGVFSSQATAILTTTGGGPHE